MHDIPKSITDRDLDSKGEFNFDKMLKLQNPTDFLGYKPEAVGEVANNRYFKKGALQESILIDLESNFDIEASIEYEYDQATYSISLDELTKDEDDEKELTVTKSHEQGLLEFKRNDDKVRTVVRELEATNIDSEGSKKRHMLSFRNYQPEVLPMLADDVRKFISGEAGKQCMFV